MLDECDKRGAGRSGVAFLFQVEARCEIGQRWIGRRGLRTALLFGAQGLLGLDVKFVADPGRAAENHDGQKQDDERLHHAAREGCGILEKPTAAEVACVFPGGLLDEIGGELQKANFPAFIHADDDGTQWIFGAIDLDL